MPTNTLENFTENACWLIDSAASEGYNISRSQLSRWHRAGLLPRPKQVQTVGRPGSNTLYPQGTVYWLLLLCHVRQSHRSLERIGWNLFLLGMPVLKKYWRARLENGMKELELFVKQISESNGSDAEERDVRQTVPDKIKKSLKSPISHPFFGSVKKYVGVQKTADLLVQLINVLLGNFENMEKRFDEYLNSELRTFAVLFADVPSADLGSFKIPSLDHTQLAKQLYQLSEIKLRQRIGDKFQSMSDVELLKHACELSKVIGFSIGLVRFLPSDKISPAHPAKLLPIIDEILTSEDGAQLFLLSLAIAENPQLKILWDDIILKLQQAAKNSSVNQSVVKSSS
jgi:hypothetical protein